VKSRWSLFHKNATDPGLGKFLPENTPPEGGKTRRGGKPGLAKKILFLERAVTEEKKREAGNQKKNACPRTGASRDVDLGHGRAEGPGSFRRRNPDKERSLFQLKKTGGDVQGLSQAPGRKASGPSRGKQLPLSWHGAGYNRKPRFMLKKRGVGGHQFEKKSQEALKQKVVEKQKKGQRRETLRRIRHFQHKSHLTAEVFH